MLLNNLEFGRYCKWSWTVLFMDYLIWKILDIMQIYCVFSWRVLEFWDLGLRKKCRSDCWISFFLLIASEILVFFSFKTDHLFLFFCCFLFVFSELIGFTKFEFKSTTPGFSCLFFFVLNLVQKVSSSSSDE